MEVPAVGPHKVVQVPIALKQYVPAMEIQFMLIKAAEKSS